MFSVRSYMPRTPRTTSIAAAEPNRIGRPRLREPIARVPKAGKPKRLTQRTADMSYVPRSANAGSPGQFSPGDNAGAMSSIDTPPKFT